MIISSCTPVILRRFSRITVGLLVLLLNKRKMKRALEVTLELIIGIEFSVTFGCIHFHCVVSSELAHEHF